MARSSAVRKAGAGPRAASSAAVALALLFGLNLFNYIDRYILFGVQPLIQKEFAVNDAKFGALTLAFFLTYMVAAPATGWLGDWFPRKPLIVAGAMFWSVLTLLTALVHSYQALFLRHALVGIGEATFGVFAPVVLADFYPEIDRNRILSIFYIAIPVGAALGYLTGGVLGYRYGWRMPFMVSAVPAMLIALLFWAVVKEPARGTSDRLEVTVDRATLAGMLHNPGYWTATLGMAALVFSMGGISAFLPTFFVRFGGLTGGRAGLIVGAITAIDGLLGTVIGGWLAQRWLRRNYRALYLLSAWSALLTIPGALLVFFGPRWVMIPAAVVAEFFLFLSTGPLNTAIVNSVSASIRSTAIALNLFLIHALGDASSPPLIGLVSDHSSLRLGMGLTVVTFAISAGLLFAGARFAPRLDGSDELPR
jgi:MFS transporter, Spinster family, sphingosine-1-phosphate transporter